MIGHSSISSGSISSSGTIPSEATVISTTVGNAVASGLLANIYSATIINTTVGNCVADGRNAVIQFYVPVVISTVVGNCIADGKKADIKFGNSNIKAGDRLVTSLLPRTITITLK